MSLKSPITYSDWYWKHRVDVQLRIGELTEQEISPLLASVMGDIPVLDELPAGMRNLLSFVAEPSGQMAGAMVLNTAAEIVGSAIAKMAEPAQRPAIYASEKLFHSLKIDANQTAALYARKKISEDVFKQRMEWAGFEPVEADFAYKATKPFPSITEVMSWARYHDDFDNIRKKVWEVFDVPVDDFDMWEWHSQRHRDTQQIQSMFTRGLLSEQDALDEFGRIGWDSFDRVQIKDLAYQLPNSMLLVQGGLIQEVDEKTLLENISKGGIHPDWVQTYYDAVLTKPDSRDLVAYHLRIDPKLEKLEPALKSIGIHPEYTDVYKTLAYQIPPVADIITMAVREAFSPTVAAKFGQYEDFPKELETFAAQKGLSKEWAERYWAAHWALPSPQQGFEMLHRGVIDRNELDLLLRAQDVMPFWRGKLTQIAFRPLTRVDVRRMYREGVLDEREVYESYLEQGYDESNAERMADFTVQSTLTSLSKFTSSDIVKAYSTRMIDRGEATQLLRTIGVRQSDATYVLSTAEYKRVWEFTDEQIKGIRNLYKKRIYSENQARDRLAGLNLPSEQIEVLMQQWFYDKVDELDATWSTAQTLKFLKRGIITAARARQELYLNGYTQERIDVYIKDSTWTPPQS